MRALTAFVLCYVLITQGFAAHHHMMTQAANEFHEICLSNPEMSGLHDEPQDRTPSHNANSPCCLIFGSGDLPRLVLTISTFEYVIHPEAKPSDAFQHRPNSHLVFAPSLPRAPPQIG